MAASASSKACRPHGGCSGNATTKGAIAFTLKDSYGQFNRLRHHGGGVIH